MIKTTTVVSELLCLQKNELLLLVRGGEKKESKVVDHYPLKQYPL